MRLFVFGNVPPDAFVLIPYNDMTPVLIIALWGAAFLLTHLIPSHPPIRARLVSVLGEWPFRGVYSIVAAITFGGMVWSWWNNQHDGDMLFFARQPAIVHGAELVVMIGFGLISAGVVVPTPASIGYRGETTVEPSGMLAVTRHPLNMGIALVAISHMVVNGWASDMAFWGMLLMLAIFGPLHEDYRKRLHDERYRALCNITTLLPWPTPSRLRHVGMRGWLGFAAGVIAAVVIRFFHAGLFGA